MATIELIALLFGACIIFWTWGLVFDLGVFCIAAIIA